MLLEAKPFNKRHGQNGSGDGELHSVLFTVGHACTAMDSPTATLQLSDLSFHSLTNFSYAGTASAYTAWFLAGN